MNVVTYNSGTENDPVLQDIVLTLATGEKIRIPNGKLSEVEREAIRHIKGVAQEEQSE